MNSHSLSHVGADELSVCRKMVFDLESRADG